MMRKLGVIPMMAMVMLASCSTSVGAVGAKAGEHNHSVATTNLQAVEFLNRTTGVAVTDSAFAPRHPPMRLAVTSDGGQHWQTEGAALPTSFWSGGGATGNDHGTLPRLDH